MARRELSSTLKNLKFMQRAALREERTKKEDDVKPARNFPINSNVTRKCVVIIEGDPHPSALKGRMSFQSFNPSVDKLNDEEEARLGQPAAETTISRNQSGNVCFRENSSLVEGPECSNLDKKKSEVNGNVKRKQVELNCEAQYPNKLPKNDQGNRQSSPKNFNKPMGDKLDWNVLRPSKCQAK
ncbi:uncharacterized protein LOC133311449 [Gastrolobium bilobum]|uniref:uncharacterized protein LOC133311449 n=1 Tax=Gastrolobium bilobum TaxID=150636 RepID=UPI002AAF80B2|nr:uncharacterized protein LOC133311449 [Gastrolobium bilobum]